MRLECHFDCQLFDKIGIIASRSYLDMRCSCFFFFRPSPYKYNSVVHYLFHISSIIYGAAWPRVELLYRG